MSHLRNQLRSLFEQIARPIDIGHIMKPVDGPARRRSGWWVGVAAAAAVLVLGVTSLTFMRADDPGAEVAGASTATSSIGATTTLPLEETSTTVSQGVFVPQVMAPTRIQCSSELADFPCRALVDGDEATRWNAVNGGVGDEVHLIFDPPLQIVSIDFLKTSEPEAFARNARIREMRLTVDDLAEARVFALDDTAMPQSFSLDTQMTAILTLTVTSAYPATSYEGLLPFTELALAEIRVWGRATPEGTIVDGLGEVAPHPTHFTAELTGWAVNSAVQNVDGSSYVQIVKLDPTDVDHPEVHIISGPEATVFRLRQGVASTSFG